MHPRGSWDSRLLSRRVQPGAKLGEGPSARSFSHGCVELFVCVYAACPPGTRFALLRRALRWGSITAEIHVDICRVGTFFQL